MDDERFVLNDLNKFALIITILCFVFMILMLGMYINESANAVTELPKLETTKGRTSTKHPTTTTTTETTTTTTTTTRVRRSPYYDVNLDKYIDKDLVAKHNLSKEEAEEIVKEIFEFGNSFYNISDSTIFDIDTTIAYSKVGDKDLLVDGNNKYGIIYDYDKFGSQVFTQSFMNALVKYKYKDISIFKKEEDKLYRLSNILGNCRPVIASIKIDDNKPNRISSTITYYLSNYKEEGYSAPQYASTEFNIVFLDGRWKIEKYVFPVYVR